MNQYQWTFLDHVARRHTLGIAHSPTSGHLVVHCDMRVVTIDFGVLEPKSYSFFIEEELCHFKIEGSAQAGFTYKFDIDHDVDTAVNRDRKIQQLTTTRSDNRRLGIIIAFIVVLLGGVGWWGYSSTQDALPTRLRTEGLPALASLRADGRFEFLAGTTIVVETPLGEDVARLDRLRELVAGDPSGASISSAVTRSGGFPVLWRERKPRHFVVDWQTIFTNLENPVAPGIPAADYLAFGLTRALPEVAGAGTCALRVAGKTGGYYNQLALLDAYLLGKEQPRQRWERTFAEVDYGANLRRVCPPPDAESAAPKPDPAPGGDSPR